MSKFILLDVMVAPEEFEAQLINANYIVCVWACHNSYKDTKSRVQIYDRSYNIYVKQTVSEVMELIKE